MLIRLISISGKGFMSFRKTFEFSMANYEGKTIQIDGRNLDDEKSQSNGSGKSTLLESFCYGWFGELCRKNRYKDEIIHKKEKQALIQTVFTADSVMYKTERTIERKKTPNLKIWKEETELFKNATYQVKQNELEKVLQINFISFQCAVMFGRDFNNFPDLKPAERAKILTDVRGLDKYVSSSLKAGESAKSLQSLVLELDKSIGNKEGELTGVRSTSYKINIDTFESERVASISSWKESLVEEENELNSIQLRIDEKTNKIKLKIAHFENSKNILIKETGTKQEASDRTNNIQSDLNALVFRRDNLKIDMNEINNEIQTLTKQGEGPCPFCAQTITGSYLQSRINQLGLEAMGIKSEWDTIPDKERSLRDQLKVSKSLVDEIDKKIRELDTIKDSIRDLKVELSHAQADGESTISASVITITNLKNDMLKKSEEINPYLEMEENRKKQIRELGSKIRGMNETKNGLLDKKKYFDFWVDGFKKIRMMLFDSMISQLESLAQHHLSEYSSELNIIMATERETRSGTIKDEFHIAIVDGNGDEVSYEMYSGGERQKIRLSISRALSQFIKEGCSVDFSFIAFDEPNDSLDDLGKESNFDTFTYLAENDGKAVLVTDHDALLRDRFDCRILVIKEGGESIIHV